MVVKNLVAQCSLLTLSLALSVCLAATAEQRTAVTDVDVESTIRLLKEKAVNADSIQNKVARRYWMELAGAEVSNNSLAEGLAHAHHAIDSYSADDVNQHIDVLFWRQPIVGSLVRVGKADQAEELLIAAVNKAKSIAGPESVAVEVQLTDLFSFYLEQKKDALALATFDQILKFDLTSGETPSQARSHSHCRLGSPPQPANATEIGEEIVHATTNLDPMRYSIVSEILTRFLKAQESVFYADDERLVATLDALGFVCFRATEYVRAENFYKRSVDISRLYNGEHNALGQNSGYHLDSLRKQSKFSEADALQKVLDEEIISAHFQRGRTFVRSEDSGTNFRFWKKEYKDASAQAIYGRRTQYALENALSYARQAQDWPEVSALQQEQIIILEHTSTPSVTIRAHYFSRMEKAFVKSGQPESLKIWIKKNPNYKLAATSKSSSR